MFITLGETMCEHGHSPDVEVFLDPFGQVVPHLYGKMLPIDLLQALVGEQLSLGPERHASYTLDSFFCATYIKRQTSISVLKRQTNHKQETNAAGATTTALNLFT